MKIVDAPTNSKKNRYFLSDGIYISLAMKALLAIALVAVSLIVILWIVKCTGVEHMSKIRRGVGFGNSADEIPVASGIIHSAPIMDMTHTYWDGVTRVSCDECPNVESCPSCMRPDKHTGTAPAETFDVLRTCEDGVLPKYVDGAPVVKGSDGPLIQDFDDFGSSRERMGASTSKGSRGSHPLFTDGNFDYTQDLSAMDDKSFALGRKGCKPSDASTIRLLYTDVMALNTDAGPAQDDCEFLNQVGYVYKEPCDLTPGRKFEC